MRPKKRKRMLCLPKKKKKIGTKEKEKERRCFCIVRSPEMWSNVLIRLRVFLRVVKPQILVCLGFLCKKKTFSEPEWQDPEFLERVRNLECLLRVQKYLAGGDDCAGGQQSGNAPCHGGAFCDTAPVLVSNSAV